MKTKIDANQEDIKATTGANNEKFEVLQNSLVSQLSI
jgi:hypothetical protein